MFKIDTREIQNLESDLKTFAGRAFPFATKQTLNRSAFEAQKTIKRAISSNMIERNKYTGRSIQVEQTRTLNVNQQESVVGSTADYMETQEFGGTKHKGGKEGTPIPTAYSAGQAMNATPRARLPRRANTLKNIRLQRQSRKAKNRMQRNIIAIRNAVETGDRFVFLKMKRKRGIFRVVGGARGTKRGWPKGAKIRMVYDLTEQSVRIPKTPTFAPSVDKTQQLMPGFYRDALIFQLKRNNLFKR